MIGRVTSQQILMNSAQNVGFSKASLARLQDQASSGKAIGRPSDDPAAAAAAMRVRGEQRANQQYSSNIDDGLGWLSAADSSLGASEDLMQKAVELAVQGSNSGVLYAADREAIATQLDGIRTDLLSQSNSTYNGRSVFSGNSDSGHAFDSSYAFSGTTGSTVQRRVSPTETVTVDANGAAAFGTGTGSVFAAIDNLTAALRSGNAAGVSTGLDALNTHLASMSAEHAAVGARYARLETAKSFTSDAATALETRRSGIEDIDQAKVLVDLKTQELSYQTALSVTAKAIQPTLMSFLS